MCGKEEHVHTHECFDSKLICGIEEGVSHKHDENCYGYEDVLVCKKKESNKEGGHIHDENCWKRKRVLVCGEKDTGPHKHDESCYKRVGKAKCGLKEHTHEDICWSDHSLDRSSPEIWEKDFEGVELSGIWSEDLLTIAETQDGRGESKRNYLLDSAGNMKGYTRYSEWWNEHVYYNKDDEYKERHLYDDWCASFISFCLYYTGIPREVVCWENGCTRWVDDFKDAGLYEDAWEQTYTPQPGDIVFLNFTKGVKAEHVAIVKSVDVEKHRIYTIEGNNHDIVMTAWYTYTSRSVLGFCNIHKAQAQYVATHNIDLPTGKVVWQTRIARDDVISRKRVTDTLDL